MTTPERVVRVIGGLLLGVAGAVWVLTRLHGPEAVTAWTLLVIGVVDLTVSGALGYCPVYRFVPAPWARRSAR